MAIVLSLGIAGLWPLVPSAEAQKARTAPKPVAQPAAKSLAQSLNGPAKTDYETAKVLASDGDFGGALIKFQSAYETSNDVRLLWNVAFCHKNLRHYAKVISTLQHYLADAQGLLTEKDRVDAQELIQTIEPFTTRLTVRISEDGSAVVIDGDDVGMSPLAAPVVVDIGERKIRVMKSGFVPYEKTMPFGGSAEATVDVKLEKELHEGRLVVSAPGAATVFLDDRSIGTGKVDTSIASGGHQLRVTAPGMRNFQSEIVIQDHETRSVDVILEKQAEAEKPRIRVMVGCGDSEPRGPEDGLVAYLDGPEVLQASYVAKKWDADQERNVVDHVEYAVAPGKHTIRLRIPGCDSLAQTLTVDAARGAHLSGALQSDTFYLFRGTQGAPGHWRLGLSLWLPATKTDNPDVAEYSVEFGSVQGLSITGALVARWFGWALEASLGGGSARRDALRGNYDLPDPADVTWSRVVFRMGPRIPFHGVAFSLGLHGGLQELNLAKVHTGVPELLGGAWAGLDWQPLCDWGLSVMADGNAAQGWQKDGAEPGASLQFGAFFEPNAQCKRERATRFGLRPTAH
jgi:hypothetical protein